VVNTVVRIHWFFYLKKKKKKKHPIAKEGKKRNDMWGKTDTT
jgi:hypothetical protein